MQREPLSVADASRMLAEVGLEVPVSDLPALAVALTNYRELVARVRGIADETSRQPRESDTFDAEFDPAW